MPRITVRAGAIGICGSCGRSVLPAFVDRSRRHTATVVYGTVRVACGGRIIPFREGESAP